MPSRREALAALAAFGSYTQGALCQSEALRGVVQPIGENQVEMVVQDVRPLVSFAYTMWLDYRVQVTFEEVPIYFPGDLVEKSSSGESGNKILDPRGGSLRVSLAIDPDEQKPSSPRMAVNAALQAHESSGFPGIYQLIEHDSFFHIVPLKGKAKDGNWVEVQSPLDTKVSIDSTGKSPGNLLQELIAAAEKAMGLKILIAMSPFESDNEVIKISQDFAGVSCRDVLRHLLLQTGRSHTYALLYSNRRQCFYLSIL
jgi:hypothetical protein